MILSGELGPGDVVSQAGLARELGTSRTPLREAFRRLEEEGLLFVEPNRRAVVAVLDSEELDELYASRILLEALALSKATPVASAERREELEHSLAELARATKERDAPSWEVSHRAFHRAVAAGAGPALSSLLDSLAARSERVIRARRELGQEAWELGQADHEAIAEAVLAGEIDEAVSRLVEHLARTARWAVDVLVGEPGRAVAVSAALDLLAIAPTGP